MQSKAYIAVSYSGRKSLNEEISAITEILESFKVTPYVFVDVSAFSAAQEKEMMHKAMAEIDGCDFLIAEISYKGIGIGIEVGYAKAKGKPVLYLRNLKAEHSTTVSGISDYQIIYQNVSDLKVKLMETISKLRRP